MVVDRDSRICSTCRAAMSTPKKTGETLEHVSAHFYFSKTYTMKKKMQTKHLDPIAEYSREIKIDIISYY